uniref:Clathrin_bdg domain-containing protein n=1 Tax=Macrostomum lignano TaxID=282301 RepID=A0A1I8GVF2_9PLAT
AGLDDDDFDDFEEFQSATVEGLEQQQQQRHLTRMCSDLHAALEKLLNDALGDADAAVPDCPAEEAAAIDESVLSSLLLAESPAQMEAVSDIVTRAAHSQPATANVWSNLLDLDNSPAVKYQWSQSRFYQDLLSTMRIDPNNVLVSRRPVAAQSALCSAQGASQQFGDCGRFGGAAAALQPFDGPADLGGAGDRRPATPPVTLRARGLLARLPKALRPLSPAPGPRH